MVEYIKGHGKHYRMILRHVGKDTRDFSTYPLDIRGHIPLTIRLIQALQHNSDIDAQTHIILGATDSRRNPVNVVVGPRELRRLVPRFEDVSALPPADETYIVYGVHLDRNEPVRKEFILTGKVDPEFRRETAAKIATGNMADKGWDRNHFSVTAVKADPDDFVEMAKEAIRNGQHLGDRILSFAGLRALADENRPEDKPERSISRT